MTTRSLACFAAGYLLGLCLLVASDGLDLPIGAPKRGRTLNHPSSDPAPEAPRPPERDPFLEPRQPGEVPQPLPEPAPPSTVPESTYFGERITGDSFVFVLDKSGSMQRWSDRAAGRSLWDVVRDETIRCIEAFDGRTRFDLVVYSYESAVCFGRLRAADASARRDAAVWLRSVQPGGGTLTGEHTAWALYHYRDAERFLLLSDGLPRDASEARVLIRMARAASQRVSTFAVALDGSGEAFMRQVAAENRGTFTSVR